MSRSSDVYRLQTIDTELHEHQTRLEEIASILANSSAVNAARTAETHAAEALKEARAENTRAEHAVESQRAKIKNTDGKLYGGAITNPKELEDLQMESVSLKKHLETLEDRLLEAMVAMEDAASSHQAAETELTAAVDAAALQNADLTREQEERTSAIAQLREERENTAAFLPEDDVTLYQQLQKKNGLRVVVKLIDNACSACGMGLSRSALQDAKNSNTISRCPQCGRILYAG